MELKVEEGKCSREEADVLINDQINNNLTPPKMVEVVPRFHQCLKVLEKIFDSPEPPVVKVRSTKCLVVVYGFVDASGSGFGSTLLVKGNIQYRIGTWSSLEDENSSNWREFENLVCEIERAGMKGWLEDSTLLLATDNQTVEACLYKGNSSSEKLFDLVVRVKMVEMKYGVKIMVTHVSGERMKVQGTDGVSRGSLRNGVAVGKEMIEFCPWAKSVIDESPQLKNWIKSWAGNDSIFLHPHE